MICSRLRLLSCLILLSGLAIPSSAQPVQKVQPQSRPINLDKELEAQVNPDRAVSYYHFSLAKWHEDRGDLPKAISEMKTALRFNPESSAIYQAMAGLLARTGDVRGAIEHAQKASELNPKDPEPHWLLANIYFRPQMRGDSATADLRKAVQELEKLRELSPDDERVYNALGVAYFELDQPEKAIEAYEKFQSLASGTDNGYREIAAYYDRTGNTGKAMEYLRRALETQPKSVESLKMLAGVYLKEGKSKEAIPLYQKMLEITGTDPAAGRRLAVLLIESGQYDEAVRILNEISSKEPEDPISRILLGRAQIGLHKYPEAIETLKSVPKGDPNIEMEAQFHLAQAYEENGNRADAIGIYSRLLENVPADSDEARTNRLVFQQRLGANYWESGEREKAIGIYQEMAKADPKANSLLLQAYRLDRQFDKAMSLGKELYEKDPSSIPTGIEYAQTLMDAGKPREGAEILNRLLQTHPGEIDLYIALSQLHAQNRSFSDAQSVLSRAEALNPEEESDRERIRFQRATVYERQKDYDRAEAVFKELLKQNPSNAPVLNYLGYMLADRGVKLEEALGYIKDAVAIEPKNGAYLDSLGWVYFRLNDLEKAEKYLLEASAITRDDPTIVEHLGDLYYKTGDLRKAEGYWMQSVRLGTDEEETMKVRRKLESLQDKLRKQKPAK